MTAAGWFEFIKCTKENVLVASLNSTILLAYLLMYRPTNLLLRCFKSTVWQPISKFGFDFVGGFWCGLRCLVLVYVQLLAQQ